MEALQARPGSGEPFGVRVFPADSKGDDMVSQCGRCQGLEKSQEEPSFSSKMPRERSPASLLCLQVRKVGWELVAKKDLETDSKAACGTCGPARPCLVAGGASARHLAVRELRDLGQPGAPTRERDSVGAADSGSGPTPAEASSPRLPRPR